MSKVSLVVTLGSALACHAASAQTRGPNLLEQARTHGNVTVTAHSCGFVGGPPTLNGLTQTADIILHGTVVAADGRLSDDLYEVWTDYHIEPFDVLRSHPLAESGVPTFAVRGGVVFVEGREIAYNYRQSGQRLSMTVGEEVVVLGALGVKRIAPSLNVAGLPRPRAQQGRRDGWCPSSVRSVPRQPAELSPVVQLCAACLARFSVNPTIPHAGQHIS
jgi:hypothetical protein